MSPRRALAVGLATAGLAVPLVSTGGTAAADPRNAQTITLVCGGVSYHVAVFSNGRFSPALDLHSNTVLIPHAFPTGTVTIRDASGAVVDTFVEDPLVQGSGKQPHDLTCSYTFSGPVDDPSLPGGTFTVVGTVIVQVSGR